MLSCVAETAFTMVSYGAQLTGLCALAMLGAMVAVRRRLNVLAVVVSAELSALGGGLLRDLVIGAPPTALHRLDYAGTALVAAVAVLLLHRRIRCDALPVRILHAAGLSVFAVLGAERAFSYGSPPAAAAALGVVSALGGGVLRDALSGHVPALFRVDRPVETVPIVLASAAAAALLQWHVFQPWTAVVVVLGGCALRVLVTESGGRKQLRRRTTLGSATASEA
jgi:uncharacterized membrane protein YeiH